MSGKMHRFVMSPDLDAFRLTEDQAKTEAAKSRSRTPRRRASRREFFIRGPIPWPWIAAAARLPGKALHVATTLCLLAGMQRGGPVSLSSARLREAGVSRYSAYRALLALEKAGLAEVVRRRGQQPVVTLRRLDLSPNPPVPVPPDHASQRAGHTIRPRGDRHGD